MNIKKLLAGAATGGLMLGSMATAAFADAPTPGGYPSERSAAGYDSATSNTECAIAGAFGYFGAYGSVHDVNGYDQISDGIDDNVGEGAEGGVTGGTGDRNSNSCGSPQHDF